MEGDGTQQIREGFAEHGTDDLARSVDIQAATGLVLRWALEDITVQELLERTLDLILSISWLSFEARGSIHLVQPGDGILVMRAQQGLAESVKRRCSRVSIGECLCGAAALSNEIVFADRVDGRHLDVPGEVPHGHYIVPISTNEVVLGVINIYLREGRSRDAIEEQFLTGIADALAGVLQRRRAESRLRESEARLSAIVAAYDGLLYMCDKHYVIEFMNERFQGLIGHDPTGEICHKAIHGLDEPCSWCVSDKVFAGETERWELRLGLDDRYYMVLNRPIVHPDGSMSKLSMATDITERRAAEEALERSVQELEETFAGVVHALGSTTSQRDPYTALHQDRVARLACAIAEEMGLDEDAIEGIRVAGLLHDVGKIAVPSEILTKPGALNEMEMGIIHTHSTVSRELLQRVPFRWPIADVVQQHHERLDGTGYPMGLHGDEILVQARILAVADVVEAMASHRPYRPALGVEKALDEVASQAGTKFDPRAVEACITVMTRRGFEL